MAAGQQRHEVGGDELVGTDGPSSRGVRREDQVGRLPERGVARQRLGAGDVEGSAGDAAPGERRDEGRLVDRRTPADVHDVGVRGRAASRSASRAPVVAGVEGRIMTRTSV